jgi:amphi-Trp domain-containing protein
MEEVLFETESVQDRAAVADYLDAVAEKLRAGESVTLEAGSESISVDPPERVEFEVKVERERESGGSELSIEFELEWDENGDGSDGPLSIS